MIVRIVYRNLHKKKSWRWYHKNHVSPTSPKTSLFYVLHTSHGLKPTRSFDFHSRSSRLSLNESFWVQRRFAVPGTRRCTQIPGGIRRTPFSALIKPTSRSRYPRASVIPYNSLVAVITRCVQYTEEIPSSRQCWTNITVEPLLSILRWKPDNGRARVAMLVSSSFSLHQRRLVVSPRVLWSDNSRTGGCREKEIRNSRLKFTDRVKTPIMRHRSRLNAVSRFYLKISRIVFGSYAIHGGEVGVGTKVKEK